MFGFGLIAIKIGNCFFDDAPVWKSFGRDGISFRDYIVKCRKCDKDVQWMNLIQRFFEPSNKTYENDILHNSERNILMKLTRKWFILEIKKQKAP